MISDKELKEKYRKEFGKNPEKYYPVEFLQNLGLKRQRCEKCGKYFWSYAPRKVCGDVSCTSEYSFLDKKHNKNLSYVETWNLFSKILKKYGYVPIKRYPVTARWRADINFVEASIDDFIPYVISGEVNPPAKALVVPQPCLRFNDIENIGITGAHYSLFSMIGQHRFEKPENYNPNEYLSHLYSWFSKGLNLNSKDVVFHEDIWAGSGNFGPCIEIFSGGLELANQVYMQFRQSGSSYKNLKLKVLDMGLGHERNTWFSTNKANSYEAVFPKICSKLRTKLGLSFDMEVLKKFVKYSNALQEKNYDQGISEISKKISIGPEKLKEIIRESSAFYSLIDHSRALLVAISDGVLPSNVGGGYNLRALYRRVFDFIEMFNWNVSVPELIEWHAADLKKLFPELSESVEEVKEILDYEKKKYFATKKAAKKIISTIKKSPSESDLIKLYESRGISPEMLSRSGLKFEIPKDFYQKITTIKKRERKNNVNYDLIDQIENLPQTVLLYRKNDYLTEFKAKVLKIFDNFVVLDQTAFYPTSGGQEHDTGFLDNLRVSDVIKVKKIVLHKIEGKPNFKMGDIVKGIIDKERRLQLMKHHTATHIINGVARQILGNHIWQAGAEKTVKKARLDLTHYEKLDSKLLEEIEKRANEVVKAGLPIKKELIKKDVAEKKYGFRIYQGGAIPENTLRIVSIGNLDVEACGGTHLNNTREVEFIKIIGSKKIQDGVVRIEFVAGNYSKKFLELEQKEKKEIANLFGISNPDEIDLAKIAEIYSVRENQVLKTLKKFLKEWKNQKKDIKLFRNSVSFKEISTDLLKVSEEKLNPESLFKAWKAQKKIIENLRKLLEREIIKDILNSKKIFVEKKIKLLDSGSLIKTAKMCTQKNPELAVILIGKDSAVGSSGEKSEIDVLEKIKKYAEVVRGNKKFAVGFKLKD